MKITVELNEPIKDADGVSLPPEGQTAGRVLASVMMSQPEGNVLKFYEWAMEWHRGRAVELDCADWDLVYRFVENNKTLTILAKYPILQAFSDAKDKARNKS